MRIVNPILEADPARLADLRAGIADLSAPTRSFYVMVAISTLIAGYGLLANSTAVVIGAMLVAPLMGPIFGIALSICTGDRHLLRQAALSEALGVGMAVALGVLIGWMPLRVAFGSEIAARTEPTLYDIIIALASGLAGAYALVNPKISPALPGVAIATALVPPLGTCGLCLAAHRWEWALGAFLLFFANFLAIELAAAFVFTLSGIGGAHAAASMRPSAFLRRFGLSVLLLAGVGLFMTRTLASLIEERRLSRAVQNSLSLQAQAITGAQLSQTHLERREGALQVVATFLTPREFEPAQVADIEGALRRAVDPRVELIVRSLISRDADRAGPVFLADSERRRRARDAEIGGFLTAASHALSAGLADIPGAQLADVRRDQQGGSLVVTAIVRTPDALDPARVAELEDHLRRATRTSARLVVRSILTRDADSQRYLYEPEKKQQPLAGEALKLHRRLQAALDNQVRARVPGSSVAEFRYRERGGRLLLLAVVRTPRNFRPEEVRAIEEAFRRHVHPATDLVVRSMVGVETATTGYLSGFDEAKLAPEGSEEPAPR